MKTFSHSTAFYHTLYALYGHDDAMLKAIHADFKSLEFDRWGCKVVIQLVPGGLIEGRLSRKGNFTGKVTRANVSKNYRSYHA
jgi:hypothetical protein